LTIEVCLFITASTILNAQQDSVVVHQFTDNGTLLSNPNMGCLTFNDPQRFGSSIAYWRWNWYEIEPRKGQYAWSVIDKAIQYWSRNKMKFSFRIETADPNTLGYYCSPKWLFDEGCKKYEYMESDSILRVEPDYGDTLFLQEHAKFISALGQHLDGNPNIEFIDIGSFGLWGEWHSDHDVNITIKEKIIDMYSAAFKTIPLIMMSADPGGLQYAAVKGYGIRRDGVGSVWDTASWYDKNLYPKGFNTEMWKTAPVVLEWYNNYGYIINSDHCSFNVGVQFMLDNHVTYINDNIGSVPDSVLKILRQLVKKCGYRFMLNTISNSAAIQSGDTLAIEMLWSNTGVAPLYRNYRLVLSLLDGRGNVVSSQMSPQNITQWFPGTYDVKENMIIPSNLPAGNYTIGVSFVNQTTNQADIQLPMNVAVNNGIYAVSGVQVQSPQSAPSLSMTITWPVVISVQDDSINVSLTNSAGTVVYRQMMTQHIPAGQIKKGNYVTTEKLIIPASLSAGKYAIGLSVKNAHIGAVAVAKSSLSQVTLPLKGN